MVSITIEGEYQRSKRGRVVHHKLLRLAREELAKRFVFPSNVKPICQNVLKRDTQCEMKDNPFIDHKGSVVR